MLKRLLAFDLKLRQSIQADENGLILIGLDEVGRGSAIGPVVAAAVSIPLTLSRTQKKLLSALNDSKQLKPSIRKELSEAVHSLFRVGIGEASLEEVDTLNVYYASLLADWRAYQAWCAQDPVCAHLQKHHYILIDGKVMVPEIPATQQKAIIKGDGLSACIAAASVVAKEYRDQMIIRLAEEHPHYGWETNIGYLTPPHRRAIELYGRTPYHRKNFLTKTEKQLALELLQV